MQIEEKEQRIAEHLSHGLSLKESLEREGYSISPQNQPKVTLLDANGRKKKRNASADNWSADSGLIRVGYGPVASSSGLGAARGKGESEAPDPQRDVAQRENREDTAPIDPAEAELLKSLDRAESTPGWSFVPLRKFRDEILPQERFASTLTDAQRRDLLDRAINVKKLILTGKVTNPKAPQFPVTTIRLNRLMPEVAATLGQANSEFVDFRPVRIVGEPLSATVLRERR